MEKSQAQEMALSHESLGKICDYMGQILRVIGPEGRCGNG